MVQEIVIENAQLANEDEIVNPTKTSEEIEVMKKPVSNAVKTKGAKKTIKGLHFENVVVIYKDEIGRLEKARFSFDCPVVDKDWYQPAARKMLSLWFEEQNILPTQVISVMLPSQGAKEVDIEPAFLLKPIGNLDKKEIIWAAIYNKFRTVKGALVADAEEMQRSLWKHLKEQDKKEGEDNWVVPEFDPTAVLEEIK